MELTPGQQLGHYRIEGIIGRGGMGAVYRATDARLDREVAIKVLPAKLTADPERQQRFRQESQLAASFNHPNIATVYDVGDEDGVTFIVMELVRGQPLRDLIDAGPLDMDRALDIATGVATGLAKAHGEGVLHRDLKPDNVVMTDDGTPKILDFGLGKLMAGPASPDEPAGEPAGELAVAPSLVSTRTSPHITQAGQLVGTLAYMSPEQVQGRPVNARSDVFSFGVLLYEILAGSRPFVGESSLDTVTAILRDEPAPLEELRRDIPADLTAILARCLAKDPSERFASGQEVCLALLAAKRRREAPQAGVGSLLKRPAPLAAILLAVVLVGGGLAWMVRQNARVSWARNEALPEIERLFESGDRDAAMRLLYEASEIIPDDPYLEEHFAAIGLPLSFESDPPGASVYAKGYNHPEREWMYLGETPLVEKPIAFPTRFRVEKDGYAPFEGAPFNQKETFRLFRPDEIPPGMVHVSAGSAGFGSGDPVDLDEFWIDTYEVTNREYKAFLDAGGYRDDRLWPEGVDSSAFVDTTGRPGPAGWTLGSFPEGQDEHPVGGVSWFEASAYAAWAGKSLPTVFHWQRATRKSIFSDILRWSNFDPRGPAPVGSYDGIGPYGTYDMAGNVREWCVNSVGDQRYILGGAWSDPDYLYRSSDSADPQDRSAMNGFRLIKTESPLPEALLAPRQYTVHDFRQQTVIDDDVYALVRQSFDFDARDLDAKVESTSDRPDNWRHELVSVRTAYSDERLPIHLFLPKNATPPYQAVLYFPSSSALFLRDGTRPSFPLGDFIPRSGRALVYPIFQGTYDRQVPWAGPNDDRDLKIQIGKDLRRAVDYIETREDLDADKIAYYGLSWGGSMGPMMTAIEPRFAASILLAGGMRRYADDWPAVAVPQNFAPRVTTPTLMINGSKDFGSPVETEIQPMFDLLGTPDEHKRLVVLDGGHVPGSPNEIIKVVLDWLDRYLGEVS